MSLRWILHAKMTVQNMHMASIVRTLSVSTTSSKHTDEHQGSGRGGESFAARCMYVRCAASREERVASRTEANAMRGPTEPVK